MLEFIKENLPKPSDLDKLSLNYQKLAENKIKIAPELLEKYKSIFDAIFGNSEFLSFIIHKDPEFVSNLLTNGLKDNYQRIMAEIKDFSAENKENLKSFLRKKKLEIALLTAISELSGHWQLDESMEKFSKFADICVYKAAEFLLKEKHQKNIIKLADENRPFYKSGLLVVAVGKLGAWELNYSSDIDIIVFFEDEKLEYLGRKNLQQFFIDVAQELSEILSDRTVDGYVFRVDLRLRPDPAANPLAVNLKKAEDYYFTVGQNWERAAMIKARFVCGDAEASEFFFNFMSRNVWRKHLEFETIEDIHSIKRQIDTKQGIHPDNFYGYNVKLGKGGIREIEFFCQTQQLIWGGRRKELREIKTTKTLDVLFENKEISEEARNELKDSYYFLRSVEHRLQMMDDEQRHYLPKTEDKFDKFAVFCGFENSKSFTSKLLEKISNVRKHYTKLFEDRPSLSSDIPDAEGSLIFTGDENHPDTIETLTKLGFSDADKISNIIRGWHHGRYECTKRKKARAVLTKLIPPLLSKFSKTSEPDAAFIRLDNFVSHLDKDNQFFTTILNNPDIIDFLAEIMSGYPEIADSLCKNPNSLDYVLEPEFYNVVPNLRLLKNTLTEFLKGEHITNLDELYEAVKEWAFDKRFRIGVQMAKDTIRGRRIIKGLSNIAEACVDKMSSETIKSMAEEVGIKQPKNFAIIALGKLGSRELTYNSDLDIVFVYDETEEANEKDLPMDTSKFFNKVAGKIIHALSAYTGSGKLYEVDLRLRPLGEKGPLATSYSSFNNYYDPSKKEGTAWIWEYMALTRARVIFSNNEAFKNKLDETLKEKLKSKWDEKFFYEQVQYIYKKFRESKKVKNYLHIKNSVGGMFDLQFLLRFLQLKYINQHEDLIEFKTNKLIDKLAEKQIFTEAERDLLKNAFRLYTKIQNKMRITSESTVLGYTEKILCKMLKLDNSEDLKKLLEFNRFEVKNLFMKHLQISEIDYSGG